MRSLVQSGMSLEGDAKIPTQYQPERGVVGHHFDGEGFLRNFG